jgi:adenosylcobyric acid synthase
VLLTQLGGTGSGDEFEARIEAVLDGLAVHIAEHVDLDRLLALAR